MRSSRNPVMRRIAGAASVLALLAAVSAAAAEPRRPVPLTLAVVPTTPPVELYAAWTPFLERLSRETGLEFTLQIQERMSAFLDAVDAGVPDLIFAAPNMFFLSQRSQGYVPLLRSSVPLAGIVFVRDDSPVRTVRDLQGKSLAFVGPMSVCAVITRHALLTSGTKLEYTRSFAGSAINVVRGVLIGKVVAGATLDGSIVSELGDVQNQLRVILKTPPIAAHPLAAHPRVPADVRERITAAVLAIARREGGERELAAVRLSAPVRADFRRDYLPLADMELGDRAALPR